MKQFYQAPETELLDIKLENAFASTGKFGDMGNKDVSDPDSFDID